MRMFLPAALVILGAANVAFSQEVTPSPSAPAPLAKCPYPTASAAPLETKLELVAKADDHTQFRVEFNGVQHDRVPAYLYVPKPKADAEIARAPAILLQYGTGGNKTTNYIVGIGKRFVARGYVVLTIDSLGCGERRTPYPKWNAILDAISVDKVMQCCGDYSRAVDYLASRGDVDRERLGFVGISRGAINGLTYVAYDERIRAAASLVGGGNFSGVYSEKLAERIAQGTSRSSDPVYHVARIAPRPLLFINATNDQLIFKPWAESLHEVAGNDATVVWLETDHIFNGVDKAAVCDTVIDFMDAKLASHPAGE